MPTVTEREHYPAELVVVVRPSGTPPVGLTQKARAGQACNQPARTGLLHVISDNGSNKPIDAETVLAAARETSLLVTVRGFTD